MSKSKYIIKFTDKKTGETGFYRTFHTKNDVINGVRCTYTEYELTDITEKALMYDSPVYANSMIDTIKSYQPEWCKQFDIEVHRLPTRREQITLDMSPLKMMIQLVGGYKKANMSGKAKIRKKLFDKELVEACLNALEDINSLK